MVNKKRAVLFLLLAVFLAAFPGGGDTWAEETGYSPERSSFSVSVKKLELPYRVNSLFLLPGEEVTFKVSGDSPKSHYSLEIPGSEAPASPGREWKWKAPMDAGLYTLGFSRENPADAMLLNVFVMVPFEKVRNGRLDGYLVGEYPSLPLKGLSIYKPPKGFVQVTRENEDVPVSPHFRLGQFLCKQAGDYPKFVVLQEKLLLKLELLLEKANAKGIRTETFYVMSGYRTPSYNKAIGNVKYSRHLWGGAADIFVDSAPRDGYMDDLNGDGIINYRDAKVLFDLVDSLYGEAFYIPFIGGLGLYKKSSTHGPYIHVDVRGTHTRWGD